MVPKNLHQCDQMARNYVFNIWTFTAIKLCPIPYGIYQRRLTLKIAKFWESGQISPTLVTLIGTKITSGYLLFFDRQTRAEGERSYY